MDSTDLLFVFKHRYFKPDSGMNFERVLQTYKDGKLNKTKNCTF